VSPPESLAPAPPDVPERERLPAHRAQWDELAIRLGEQTLTALARRLADRLPELDRLEVRVRRGELSVSLVVRRFGVPLSARARLSQLRLKDGFLAFMLEEVDALSFIPIPDAVIGYLIEKAPAGLVTYYPADRIVVINLDEWMPRELDLTLEDADLLDREVRLRFGPGGFDLTGILGAPAPGL
jgi:hypothetical protein